jgi:anti-anti-sigma factor
LVVIRRIVTCTLWSVARSPRPVGIDVITVAERYYDVDVAHDPVATIITVRGEMDLFASPALADALDAALVRSDGVVVDLTECSLFESSGLNALLTAHLAAESAGRRIHVVRERDSCADRTLSLTVPGFFTEHDSRDAALGSLAG